MIRRSIIKNSIAGMLLMAAVSCKKLDLAPTDRFTDATYWTTSEKAAIVLNTAYAQMFGAATFFYNEGLSDNAYSGRGDQEGVTSISSGLADASLPRFKNEWNDRYRCIKTCNIILGNIDRVPGFQEGLKNRMKAEARVIRAFQYFQLYTWYGDVPLFDHDLSVTESQTIVRAPRQQVVDFVMKELDESAALLPVNTQYGAEDRGRITKGAALALKARVLLYEGRWQDVINTTEPFLTGNTLGTYGLFNSYEGLFLPQNEYNSEVIFDLQFVPESRTYNVFFDLAPLGVGARLNAMAPTQELVDDYIMLTGKGIKEAGSGYNENDPYINRDPRLTNTVVYHQYKWKKPDNSIQTIYIKPGSDPNSTKLDEYMAGSVSSPTGYYIRKYYDPASVNNFNSGLNLVLIRYADLLLMYAEAKSALGQFTEGVWNQTIRALRVRAGFTEVTALNFNGGWTTDERMTIVRRERRAELAFEGLRIFDIRRWKTAETVLKGWVHGAKYGEPTVDNGYIRVNQRSFDAGKHYLWAIPRDERNLNKNLSQNNSW
ncbi:RagB/SusD family nutrient uptake outer membrane protein [Paraflavitalea speifideaquila]|uniref:RagB/SusD family nutrient uptake outer membrane protein n=1 Tax=Paraflavitalea speifideaquila TaxID=3076558 RepID=UPI0028E1AC94|nr:RagB/SusD family nutrient uptake outer membrane protein [Paraflavitalea speifideiaquila]